MNEIGIISVYHLAIVLVKGKLETVIKNPLLKKHMNIHLFFCAEKNGVFLKIVYSEIITKAQFLKVQ